MGYTARRALQPRNTRIYRAYYVHRYRKVAGGETVARPTSFIIGQRSPLYRHPTTPAFVSVFEFSPPVINVIPLASCDDAVFPRITRYQPLSPRTDFTRMYTITTTIARQHQAKRPTSLLSQRNLLPRLFSMAFRDTDNSFYPIPSCGRPTSDKKTTRLFPTIITSGK